MIKIYIDGLCQPQPHGIGAYGLIIYQEETKIHQQSGIVGQGVGITNNVCEFTSLIRALTFLLQHGLSNEDIDIHSDSQLLVGTMTGVKKVIDGAYVPKYHLASKLSSKFSNLHFTWIHRDDNEEADRLAHCAYDWYMLTSYTSGPTEEQIKELSDRRNKLIELVGTGEGGGEGEEHLKIYIEQLTKVERALLEAKLYMHPYRWEREGGIAIFDSKLIGQVAMEEVNDELET